MLKKLLKYDFKAVLKYWWIVALSTVALSFLGGWSISIFTNEKDLPVVLYVVATLVAIVSILGVIAFSILTIILIFSRFYKNFFTDEGYLTFTLPVKRGQLLNSKLIVSVVMGVMTGLILLVDLVIALSIGIPEFFLDAEFWSELWKHVIAPFFKETGAYSVVFIIEAIVLMLLSVVLSSLFVFCCITIASIIAKKAKIITAIAIYYVANSAFTFVTQMFYIFGLSTLSTWFGEIPDKQLYPVVALVLLGAMLFIGMLVAMLYALQYWMLDRKLNLS